VLSDKDIEAEIIVGPLSEPF